VIRPAIAAMFTLSVAGLCGAGAPPAKLARFVVLRTAGDVYTGERVRYDAGRFVVEDAAVSPGVPEGDVVHLVFVPALDAPGLSTAMGLAMRVAAPDRLKRLTARRGDMLNALTRSGGVFFLASDDPARAFPEFVRKTRDPDLTGVLCYELAKLCRRRKQEKTAVRLLAEAEKRYRGSDRGFVCGIMHAALLRAMDDKRAEDAVDELAESCPARRIELGRFSTLVLGRPLGRRRRGPDERPGRPGLGPFRGRREDPPKPGPPRP